MPTSAYPGVHIEEVTPLAAPIARVDPSITLFVGLAVRGPVGRAIAIASVADATRRFGPATVDAPLVRALEHYFLNGGRLAQVVRVAAPDARSARAEDAAVVVTAIGSGTADDGLQVRITPDATDRFDLDVIEAGQVVERFTGLTRDGAPNAVAKDSVRIRLATKTMPSTVTALTLGGGSDGTMRLGDAAFGAALDACFAPDSPLDAVDFALVCVPGLVDAPILGRLRDACRARRAFLVADADPSAAMPAVHDESAADGAFYTPWLRAGGAIVPPSPFVAGVYARIDADRGVWKAPAGPAVPIRGAQDLATTMSPSARDAVVATGLNPLVKDREGRLVVLAARTLADPRVSPFHHVPVRRLQQLIDRSLARGLAWTVFEPMREALWTRVRAAVDDFLVALWKDGAFAGTKPEEGAYVRCGRDTMTAADIAAGRLVVEIGYAPARPAEFIVFRLDLKTAEAA